MGRKPKGDRCSYKRIKDYVDADGIAHPRWEVTLWLEGARTRTTCDSEAEARRTYLQLSAQIRRGTLTAPRDWEEAEEMFRQARIDAGTRESSFDSTYPARFKAVRTTLGVDDPLALSEADGLEHKRLRLVEGRSASTVNGELNAVTALQRWAAEKGWLRRVTWEDIPRLEEEPRDVHLAHHEVGSFLRAAAKLSKEPPGKARPDDWAWWEAAVWAFMLGLRSHEATQLKVGDIDIRLGVLRIGMRRGFVVKSKRSRRLVPFLFSAEATRAFRELVEGRAADEPAFPSRRRGKDGKRLHFGRNGHHFRKRCHLTCAAAEVTDVHPHALRHSLATALAMDGADMRSVGELLGHDPAMTERTYSHTTLGRQLAAARAAGQMLDRAVQGKPVLQLIPGGAE